VANAYTDITSGTSLGLNLVKTGYEKLVAFKLRSEPLFRRVADTRATSLTNPGSTITFNIYNDLTADTTTLTETVTPDSVAVGSTSTVSVTINEMGKTVIPTLALRTYTFSDVDPAIANIIARDQAESVDLRVRAVFDASVNRITANGTTFDSTAVAVNTIVATDLQNAAMGAAVTARLRSNSVLESMPNNTFGCFLHPDQAYDLKRETGELGWRYPHNNVAPENLWLDQVGVFGGISYIETPRVKTAADGAAGAKVYRSYFFGQQALAEVVAVEPHIVIGPVVDPMMRFRPLSWHGIAGWGAYRAEAFYRGETGSSLSTFV
jgi:N4-gp56 family major capsid protein